MEATFESQSSRRSSTATNEDVTQSRRSTWSAAATRRSSAATDEDVTPSSRRRKSTAMQLSDMVAKAANESSMRLTNRRRSSITLNQLNIAKLKLHGREEDMKMLRGKLREFTKVEKEVSVADSGEKESHELLLIAGVSGSGKSALVKKGIEEPAQKMGIAFAGGKFDLNKSSALPLSAFSAAMSSLTRYVITSNIINNKAQIIRDEIKATIREADLIHLFNIMPSCQELFNVEDGNDNESLSSVDEEDVDLKLLRSSSERLTSSMTPPSIPSLPRKASPIPIQEDSIEIETGGKASTNHQRLPSFSGGKAAVQRLQYSIRLFLKAICKHLKGVVLFLDDLQWSDVATLELLKSLITDKDIPSLLVVGAYREDEVSDSHPLMLQLNENQDNIQCTTINIGNLSRDNVMALVADALRMEDNVAGVTSLAATIHQKTSGNAFYVLVFLKLLFDEGLLEYNFGAMKWIWDDDAVKEKFVTENVTTIMMKKLQSFDNTMQKVLQIASCLRGSSFSSSTVASIVDGLEGSASPMQRRNSESTISDLVDELVDEGLLEKDSDDDSHYRFCHDQIQFASFELVPREKRNSFRGEIGDILMQNYSEELEKHLFEVVSLRNHSNMSSMTEEKCHELARMNLQAGMMASRNAAFDTAVVYYSTGRKLLGPNAWDVDGETMLQLCSEEANACFINGDLTTMKMLIDEVLSQDISVEDKFKIYEVKILALNAEPKFSDAVDATIEVRRQLGLPTPANKPASPLIVIREYIKTVRALGKKSPEQLASLPKLEDERRIMGMRMLESFLTAAFMSQPTVFPLGVFLMVRESIKYGICASSCYAFSTFGLIQCGAFGKMTHGKGMAKAAEMLLENPEYGRMQSRVLFVNESFVYHWTAPLQGTLAPLLSGYQKGLEIGDVESVCFCIALRSHHLWYASRPLNGVIHELETNMDVLIDQLSQEAYGMNIAPYLVAAKKLQATGDDLGNTNFGDDLDFDSILKYASDHNENMIRARTVILQLELCVLFQDIDSALNLVDEAGKLCEFLVGTFATIRFKVLEGLVHLKAAQASKAGRVKRKHKKKAAKSMKLIGKWLKSGNVNIVHALHLLSAEEAALKGNKTKADDQFKLAIKVAAKNGFMQDRGLAHELAGRYYADQGDEYWTRYHLEQAGRSYSDWGATAKRVQVASLKTELLGE